MKKINSVLAAGDLDPSFGDGGVMLFPSQSTNWPPSLLGGISKILPDGKIMTIGMFGGEIVLVRCHADGRIDESYADDGLAKIATPPPMSFQNPVLNDFVFQDDGNIVILSSQLATSTTGPMLYLARALPDGTSDATFGDGGTSLVPLPIAGSVIRLIPFQLGILRDGKIITTCQLGANTDSQRALVRFTQHGDLDKFFGIGGMIVLKFQLSNKGLTVLPNGHLMMSGSWGKGAVVVQLNHDGVIDTNFGESGYVKIPVRSDMDCVAKSIAVQLNGKIIVVGSVGIFDTPRQSVLITRIEKSGEQDKEFNNGIPLEIRNTIADEDGLLATIQGADEIIIVGKTRDTTNATVMRLMANGVTDPAFKLSVTGFNAPININWLELQADGKIFVSCDSYNPYPGPRVVANFRTIS